MALKARIDTLRSLAYTGISGTYAAVGSQITVNADIICITNLTDAAMIFSTDNTIAAGQLIVGAGGYKVFDLEANGLILGAKITVYVKQVSAPTTGSVYIEFIYGTKAG